MQLIVKYYIQRKVMKTVSVKLEWREEEGKVFDLIWWNLFDQMPYDFVLSKTRLNKLVSSKRLWSSSNFTQEVDSAEVAGDFNQWEKV